MSSRLIFSLLLLTCSQLVLAQSPAANPGTTSGHSHLGLVVDSTSAAHARDGLQVLGATPGSIADQLGLRPGDLLVDVNGTSLRDLGADAQGRALAAKTFDLRLADLPASVPLRLLVVRDGVSLAMNAPLQARALGNAAMAATDDDSHGASASEGCGRISTFDVAPRSKHQYHARIVQLDGSTPGPSGQQNYRVKTGVHELLVAEDIPTLEMGVGEMATLRRHTQKKLTVTVEPNTTYMVGAQLHLDKVSKLSSGGYWDPIVWREIAETCR